MSIFEDIYLDVKRFFYRIKRVIKYIPIIWRMYDFHYSSAIDIFSYQLSRTADFLESDDTINADAKDIAKRIRTAIKLMDLVYDDYYAMEYIDKVEKKYGKHHFDFVPLDKERSKYELQSWYGDKKPSDEKQKEISKVENFHFWESQKKQKKAERILWVFIAHNIRSWGD